MTGSDYVRISDDFCMAVEAIFPVLCFEQPQIETFLRPAESGEVGDIRVCEGLEGGRTFAAKTRIKVPLVLPSSWAQRFVLVEDAIKQMQGSRRMIRLDIDEGSPSSGAYFAGALPRLGFRMEPRIGMSAEQGIVDRLGDGCLPRGFNEVGFDRGRSDEVAEVWHQAYAAYRPEWSAAERDQDLSEWKADGSAFPEELARYHVAVEHEGRIVGVCRGGDPTVGMAINELAVLPSYQRKGIGKVLLLRCIQRLRETASTPEARIHLSTNRTYRAALSLYCSLGFTTERAFTTATWKRR